MWKMETAFKLVLMVFLLGLLEQTQNQDVSTIRVCEKHEYLDLSTEPGACRNCTVCEDALPVGDTYTLTNCTATNDTVCSKCERDLIWSEDLARCVRCGPCCSNSVVDLSCSLQGSDPGANCLFNPDCTGVKVVEQMGGAARGSTGADATIFADNTFTLVTDDTRDASTTTSQSAQDDDSQFPSDDHNTTANRIFSNETTAKPTAQPPPEDERVEPWKILAYVGCCTTIVLLVIITGFCVWRRYKAKQLRRKGVVPDYTISEEPETPSPAYGLTLLELVIPVEYEEPVYATVDDDDRDNSDDEDKPALSPRVAVLSTKARNKPASYKNKFLDVSMYDRPYAHLPSGSARLRGSHSAPSGSHTQPPSEFLQLEEFEARYRSNTGNTNPEEMPEGGFDESLFYSQGMLLDREPSPDPGALTGHNHRLTKNIPQYLSAVDNDYYGQVSSLEVTALVHAASPRRMCDVLGPVLGDSENLPSQAECETDHNRDATFCKCRVSEQQITDPEETDDTTTEMQQYIYAQENYESYVGFYSRLDTILRRLNIMTVGYPRAGKTCLVDTLLSKPFRETQCTNGIDLSECNVSTNQVEAEELNWSIPEQPFYERVNSELWFQFINQSTTPKESDLTELCTPHCSNTPSNRSSLSNPSRQSVHSLVSGLKSEMKIWDMSGEFGFYSTHQMFLSSSSVFLLVMDATKALDVSLPLSCATRSQTGKIECPKTPREFLDYWLGTVGTFAGHTTNGSNIQPHVIIVLTHTDLIDPDAREHLIQEYKTDVLNHVKMRYTCKYVHHEVFAISNKERDETELSTLKRIVIELCCSKPSYGIRKPCTWLKLEADIQKFCSEVGRKHVQLKTLQQFAERTFGMSFDELKDFLQFHHEYRNLICTDVGEANTSIENPYMNVQLPGLTAKSLLIVTDAQFLVDKFRAVITLWQFRKTSKLTNQIQRDIDRDFEKGLISMKNLKILWDIVDTNDIESLVGIMVRMNQFIRCEPSSQDSGSKFIIPSLLPPSGPSELDSGPYKKMDKLKPLTYVFHQSLDPDDVEGSGFLPVGFFFMLVASLSDWLPQQQLPWKRTKLSYNSASFRAGRHGDVLINVSCSSYVIVLNVLSLPIDVSRTTDDGTHCAISQLRQRFESAIKMALKMTSPYLYCSVCVSACPDRTGNFSVSYDCLERLGDLGHVQSPLKEAVCFKHKNHLSIEKYRCWFCAPDQNLKSSVCENQRHERTIKDQRKLQNYAKKVSNVSTLWSLGLALGQSIEEIEACRTDSATDIEHAALKMLYSWYKRGSGSLEPGSRKDAYLTDAMEESGLGNYV